MWCVPAVARRLAGAPEPWVVTRCGYACARCVCAQEFVIQVTERHSWQVMQRYSAFEALHKPVRVPAAAQCPARVP